MGSELQSVFELCRLLAPNSLPESPPCRDGIRNRLEGFTADRKSGDRLPDNPFAKFAAISSDSETFSGLGTHTNRDLKSDLIGNSYEFRIFHITAGRL